MIGQYRVTGVIGQGGMGAVYGAEHTLLGRPAAIKILLPELSRKQDVVQRFFNEARAATAIRHPGIVEIYDFGWTADGAAFIVMERLDGETLGGRSARGRMRWQAALGVARQIAGALSAAHGKGIVHRDLKPDNVFLVLDPEVPGGERIKLLDFGIAKLAGESSPNVHANATRTGVVLGTPTYMAPEQCRGVAVDHRVDVYALGCVVFELCCGRPPFVGEGAGDVLAAHIHLPPPRLAELGVDAPPAVEQLVGRLLAKSPAERIQTADEVIRAIDAITTDHVPAMAPVSPPRVVAVSPTFTTLSGAASGSRLPVAIARRERRSIALVAAVAATVTVVVVAVAMRRTGHDAAPPPATVVMSPTAPPTPQPDPVPPPAVAAAAPVAAPAPEVPTPSPVPVGSAVATAAPAPPPTAPRIEAAHPEAAHPEAPKPSATVEHAAAKPSAAVARDAPKPAPAVEHTEANPSAVVEHSAPRSTATVDRSAAQPSAAVDHDASKPAATFERSAAKPSAAPATPVRSRAEPVAGPGVVSSPAAPTTVDLALDSTPGGASIFHAGKLIGKTPYHGTLARRDADVALVVRLAGYSDKTVVVHVSRAINERVQLVRAPRVPLGRNDGVNPFAE